MTFPWSLDPPSCVLSPCGCYRYTLRIPLSSSPGVCVFTLANPSKAVVVNGVFKSDPTVTRCMGYARDWGYGTLVVVNARAWRDTDPNKVPSDPEAIGPDNDAWIERAAREADVVVCGWGRLGGERGLAVLDLLLRVGKVPHALALNADGTPQHTRGLRKDLKPFPMPTLKKEHKP